MKHLITQILCFALALSIHAESGNAGSEIFPGDYTVLPAGMQVASLFYYHRLFDDYYVQGKPAFDGQLRGRALVASYTRYGQTLGQPSSWTVLLPYIDADGTSGSFPAGFGDRTTGFSDIRLDYNFWPIYQPEKGYSLGIGSHFILPSGRYDHSQALNAGDNRWIASFQFGWIQQLRPGWLLDVTPEIKWYGRNDDYVGYSMKQSPVFALTSYLRWKATPLLEAHAGYQINAGGEQTIAGFDQNNATDQQRYFLGATRTLNQQMTASLRYSRDISVQHDVKIDHDLVLRLNWFF